MLLLWQYFRLYLYSFPIFIKINIVVINPRLNLHLLRNITSHKIWMNILRARKQRLYGWIEVRQLNSFLICGKFWCHWSFYRYRFNQLTTNLNDIITFYKGDGLISIEPHMLHACNVLMLEARIEGWREVVHSCTGGARVQ